MDGVRPRVRVDRATAPGDVVEIKTLISHPMESGQRRNSDGDLIPRQIINRFTAEFDGELVIDVSIEPAVSTNPYFEFDATVPAPGTFVFTWYDDDGDVYTAEEAVSF